MLPPVDTDDQWDEIVPDEAVMRPGVEDLCSRLGLAGAPLARYAEGSQPVYAVGDSHVLKLFPGAAAEDGIAEGRVLTFLQGRLPIPTPRVRSFGPYENGWQYVLMSRLTGEGLATAWPRIPGPTRTASSPGPARPWPPCMPWIPGLSPMSSGPATGRRSSTSNARAPSRNSGGTSCRSSGWSRYPPSWTPSRCRPPLSAPCCIRSSCAST